MSDPISDMLTCIRNAGAAQLPVVKLPHSRIKESVAKLFRIPLSRISDFVTFSPANAIKFTLYRLRPSGSPGDWDILGCQQYGPLLEVEIPD